MEKVLSSPSSVSEGEQEMLFLLSPCASNPSDQHRQVKSRISMVVTGTQLSKSRDHVDGQLSALPSYCVLSHNTNPFIKTGNKPNPSPTSTDTHPKKRSQPGHPELGNSCNTTWWCRTLWRTWGHSSLKTEQGETGECFLRFIFRRWGSLKAYI